MFTILRLKLAIFRITLHGVGLKAALYSLLLNPDKIMDRILNEETKKKNSN